MLGGGGAKGGDARDAKSSGAGGSSAEEKLTNNIFDEACDLDDEDDSVDTHEGLQPAAAQPARASAPVQKLTPQAAGQQLARAQPQLAAAPQRTQPAAQAASKPAREARSPDGGSEASDEEEDESAGGAGGGTATLEGAYNAQDYADLNVSADVRDLFPYIGRYNAHEVELDATLKCFIPDYIPAVGEMDAFIKVPRPDASRDELGLAVLDEPAAAQSDATVLELQLRAVSKKQHGDVAVRSIENAAKNPVEVDRWIASIQDLHRSKPPPQVNYRKAMPDIDKLMEEWPPELEDLLRSISLPNADLEATLPEFVKICCALMDVPVYDSLVESLHVFFSLYLEFSDNVHFAATRSNNIPA